MADWNALEVMFEGALGPAGERTVAVKPATEQPRSSFANIGSILPTIGGQTRFTTEVANIRAAGDEVLDHINELLGERPTSQPGGALGNISVRNRFTALDG